MDDTCTVREWNDVVRRARLGRTLTAIALDMGTYADFSDGSRVHPGVARVALDAEVSYQTAKRSIARLRVLGLIVLTHRSRSRGDADEYRLAIGAQLLDQVDVLTPAQLDAEIIRIRDLHRRRRKSPDPDGPDGQAVRVSPPPVDPVDNSPVRVTGPPVQPVDNSDVRVTRAPVPGAGGEICMGDAATPTDRCTGDATTDVRVTPSPTTSQGPTTTPTSQPVPDVSGNRPPAREAATATANPDLEVVDEPAPEPADPTALPDLCPHGLHARRRTDGTTSCTLCRRGLPGTRNLHIVRTA